MRKLLIALAWLASTAAGLGQAPPTQCTAGNVNASYVDTINNVQYLCTSAGWKQNVGNGAPTVACASKNYGQIYGDVANSVTYQCAAGGWFVSGGSGTGFPITLGSTSIASGSTTTSLSGLTLVAPALGTPTALNLTNAVALPWTGITGTPSTTQVPVQSLTTTGSSGPSTLSGGVLNVPQYAPSISGLTTGVIPQAGSATTVINSSPQLDTTTNANGLTFAGSAGYFGNSYNSTDTVDNAAITFSTGSGGDSTCPSPLSGTSYLCTQSSGIAASISGAAYAAIATVLGTKVFNGVSYSNAYTAYTDIAQRVNACMADALTRANGNTTGICSSEGEVGLAAGVTTHYPFLIGDVNNDAGVWLLPPVCNFLFYGSNFTGSVASTGITQYSNTKIISPGSIGTCVFQNRTAVNGAMYALYLNQSGTSNAAGTYAQTEGISFTNGTFAVPVTTASGHDAIFQFLTDNSQFKNMGIVDFETGQIPIQIGNNAGSSTSVGSPCCATAFENINVNGEYATAGILQITANSTNNATELVTFRDISIDHPAPGSPVFTCTDTSSGHGVHVKFDGLYSEVEWNSSGQVAPEFIDGTASTANACGQINVIDQEFKNEGSYTAPIGSPIWQLNGTFAGSFNFLGGTVPFNVTQPVTFIQNNMTGTAGYASGTTDSNGFMGTYSTETAWMPPAPSPSFTGGLTLDSPTGGNLGTGKENVSGGYYVNGTSLTAPPSGTAGGALNGTYPNPTLANVGAQYALPESNGAGGLTATSLNTDSTGNNLNIPAGALTLSNPGVFSNTANYFPNLTSVNGCNLNAIFAAVQYTAYTTSGVDGCVSGPSSAVGSAYNETGGGLFAATSQGYGRAAGLGGYAIITGNGTFGYGGNSVAQDVNDSATGQGLISWEFDTQPQKAASTYENGGVNVVGITVNLYNQGGEGGIYGDAVTIGTHSYGTAAYWDIGLDITSKSICTTCPAVNVNPINFANSGSNYNSYNLFNMYESYWNGTTYKAEGWGMQGVVSGGTNPTNDYLLVNHSPGTAPAGQTHYYGVAYGINLGAQKSDGTWDLFTQSTATGANSNYSLQGVSGPVLVGPLSPTNADCANIQVSGSGQITVGDAGAACNLPTGSLYGTSTSIGGSALTASCATGTATVNGAATTEQASASPTTSGAPGAFSVYASVTAPNTVTVSVCGTGTPVASTYFVSIGAPLTVSGTTTKVASANSSLGTAPSGDLVTTDGAGNLNGTTIASSNLAALNGTTSFSTSQVAPAFYPQSKTAGPNANLFEDFIANPSLATETIGSPSSNTCGVGNAGADINHPGTLTVTSGTVSGAGEVCGLMASFHSTILSLNTSPAWTIENLVDIPVLPGTTAGAYQIGAVQVVNVNPWTTGIEFYLSSANAVPNDWYCGYGTTYVDTGIAAVAGTWTRLSIISTGSTVSWFINGSATAAGCTGIAVGSMPSTAGNLLGYTTVALSTTSVSDYIDYTLFQRTLTR